MAGILSTAGLARGEGTARVSEAPPVHGAPGIAKAVRALTGLSVTAGPAGEITVAVALVSLSTLMFLAALCIGWDAMLTAALNSFIKQTEWGSDSPVKQMLPLLFMLPHILVGIAITPTVIVLPFVRTTWTFAPGTITHRAHVPLVGWDWEDRHTRVTAIECRRGLWASGGGHTDLLRYRRGGASAPVELEGVRPRSLALGSGSDQLPRRGRAWAVGYRLAALQRALRPPSWRALEDLRWHWRASSAALRDTLPATVEVDMRGPEERLHALGRLLAQQVGVPFTLVQERIPDTSSD